LTPLAAVFGQPVLRMLALLLLLLGGFNAAVYPYQSLIAIERVGLSPTAFAALLALASAVAVLTAVGFGIWGDHSGRRRQLALIAACCAATGVGLMWLAPGPLTLMLAHGLLIPLGSSLFGQGFTLAGQEMATDPDLRDRVQPVIRAAMSLAFLGLLVGFTFAFAAGLDVMSVYGVACAMGLGLVALVLLSWPADRPRGATAPQGAALAAIARPAILLRLLLLGAINAAGVLYMVLVSLVFDATPGRGPGDVALYVGLVAGWEVPFMLLLPRIAGRIDRITQIGLGTAIYCAHLVLMPLLAGSALIWVLPLLAGFGGAAILTLPIAYYQDLMQGRPGAASALIALQKLVSDILAALVFAVGMALGGALLTALLGTAAALLGALGLWRADRR